MVDATQIQELSDDFLRAVNRKDFAAMQDLLDQGADVNVQNVRGVTPLFAAIIAKNEAMVDWLLARNANPNVKSSVGDNPMIEAARSGNEALLKKLIKGGGDVNLANTLGSTPLMEACVARQLGTVRVLLDAKADVSARTNQGTSALLNAARSHEYEIVELLLAAGADANESDTTYGVTALISACGVLPGYDPADAMVKSMKTVKALLAAGANPDLKAKSGNSPLAEAARTDSRSVILELLHAGANPNVNSTAGVQGEFTPLMLASVKKDIELVKALLAAKADPSYSNNKGENAVYMAMAGRIADAKDKEKTVAILELLLSHGASAEFKKGATSMAQFGLMIDEPKLVEKAAQLGLLDQPDAEGHTALHLALHLNKHSAVKRLIELGADVNAKDSSGTTPLQMAAQAQGDQKVLAVIQMFKKSDDPAKKAKGAELEKQYKELLFTVTDELIAAGADINSANKDGDSVLMTAVRSYANGRVERSYVEGLADRGADLLHRNEMDDSAFTLAMKIGDADLSALWAQKLLDKGLSEVVEQAILDVSWTAPEHPVAVAAMKPVFERLMGMGANINAQDEDGQTALIVAAASNQEDLLGLLLDLGADPNLQNKEGETPMVQAIANNRPNITAILLARGADERIKNNDGEDLLSVAYRYQSATIINQLAEARQKRAALDEAEAARAPRKGVF